MIYQHKLVAYNNVFLILVYFFFFFFYFFFFFFLISDHFIQKPCYIITLCIPGQLHRGPCGLHNSFDQGILMGDLCLSGVSSIDVFVKITIEVRMICQHKWTLLLRFVALCIILDDLCLSTEFSIGVLRNITSYLYGL
jgi:hypothetical protein